MYLLYDLILLIASLFLLPYAYLKGLTYGNSLAGVVQRLGYFSQADLQRLQGGELFWIHAVSVGEVRASRPLIKALKIEYPDCRIVLSGMTFTGHKIAREIDTVDLAIFFPFDLSLVVNRALRAINPDLIVLIETELWPNFIRLAERHNIPIVLANGRISRKSFPRYLSLRKFVQPLLEKFSVIAMQDADCARRIKALGAPAQLVEVTGNMKFDLPLTEQELGDLQQNGFLQRAQRQKFVWVAGSIRSGEAELLLQCHRDLLAANVPSFLVLAPRHPHRFNSVAELLKKSAVPFALRSTLADLQPAEAESDVLLIDSVGELTRFYALAKVIFVGGSLVPRGGQNLLEPAQLGKPVLFGPHVFNFKEISRILLEGGAGIKVSNSTELTSTLIRLSDDEPLREKMGKAGQSLIREHAGATERTLTSIRRVLEP